jgi:hypothetical protein
MLKQKIHYKVYNNIIKNMVQDPPIFNQLNKKVTQKNKFKKKRLLKLKSVPVDVSIPVSIPIIDKPIINKPILTNEILPNQYNTQIDNHKLIKEKGKLDVYINETIAPYANEILTHIPSTDQVKTYLHQTILNYTPPQVQIAANMANEIKNKVLNTGKFLHNAGKSINNMDFSLNESDVNENKLLLKRLGKAALWGGAMAGLGILMPGVSGVLLTAALSGLV